MYACMHVCIDMTNRSTREWLFLVSSRPFKISEDCRGAGTTLKVRGGGGGNVSRGPRKPVPKTKNSLIWPTFLGETKVHVQKQTKIKMNDFHTNRGNLGVHTYCEDRGSAGRQEHAKLKLNTIKS